MRRLLLVATAVAGTLISASAFAERAGAPGNFGVGSEPSARYPWEEVRGTRPTFGGSVQAESNVGHWFDALGRPVPSHSHRASREGKMWRPRPVSVRSVEDRTEALNWFEPIGRR